MKPRAERSEFIDPNTVREWWAVNREIALRLFAAELEGKLPVHAPPDFDVFRVADAPVGITTDPTIEIVGADAYTVGRRRPDGTHEDICVMRAQQGLVSSILAMRPVLSMSLVTDMRDLGTLQNMLVIRVQCQVPHWRHCCVVIEEDMDRICAAMCTPIWGHMRALETWLYAGPGARERYIATLERAETRLPNHIAGEPDLVTSMVADLRAIIEERETAGIAAASKAAEYYTPGFGRAVADKLRAGQPINVLFYTTRWSSVLQWAARDLASGFERLGHRASVIKEQNALDDVSLHVAATCVRDTRPDLVCMISHVRSEQGYAFPARLPFVAWIQDAVSGVFGPGERDSDDDFVYGLNPTFQLELQRAGYKRPMVLPMMVNDHIYRPLPDVDVEPSVAYMRNLVDEFEPASCPGFGQWIGECCAGYPEAQPRLEEYREFVRAGIQKFGWKVEDGSLEFHAIAHTASQVGRKLDRCRVVDWLLDAGIKVAIYGTGWDKFPRHAPHWRGTLAPGDELCRAYQSHAAVLQIGQNMHCRVFETLASGGFVMSQKDPADALPGGLHENMDVGSEMGYFDTREEAIAMAIRAITDKDWRDGVAGRGRYRVLQHHTCEVRARQIVNDIIDRYPADG